MYSFQTRLCALAYLLLVIAIPCSYACCPKARVTDPIHPQPDNPVSWLQDLQERIDFNLTQKVEHLLVPIVGPECVRVSVRTVINREHTEITTETPLEGVDHRIEEDITKENTPGPLNPQGNQVGNGGTKSTTRNTTERMIGMMVREEKILPGTILSISVGIVIDLRNPIPNKDKPILDVDQVKALVSATLGLQNKRDQIAVVDVPLIHH